MAALPPPASVAEGRCSMKGSCGSKGIFGKPLPCPYDGPAVTPDDSMRTLLASVCSDTFAQGDICCEADQLETLQDNLSQAEAIISACPACRNNFRELFCHLTCSPNQSSFINVTSTQTSSTGEIAVQSIDFFVSDEFASGFYDSCKNVQFGAANAYAMDFIGGGAKNYTQLLSFLGDEKPLGSPFQIDFPRTSPTGMSPLSIRPRSCSDNDISSRCACIDCPDICPALPPLLDTSATCQVGAITCLSFVLILAYSLCFVSFMTGFGLQTLIRRKNYERLATTAETASDTPLSPTSRHRSLVGASSLARHPVGDQPPPSSWDGRIAARGVSLLDPIESVQPRQYRLNDVLRRLFYKSGLLAATRPLLTFAIFFTLVGLLNIGWKDFTVEKDPVRLWVAPNSESKIQKEYFDDHFGPFFRPQQIFITSHPGAEGALAPSGATLSILAPVLSWDHLKYWFQVESEIRSLQSYPNNYTIDDVCFKPMGPDGACVVQSVTAWFGNDIENTTPSTWQDQLLMCAKQPVECLPDFMQPLGPKYVLGGVPNGTEYLDAEAMVVTIVVSDSLDAEIQSRAMEWERTLRKYLVELSSRAPEEAGLRISFSTGVSLEEELNKSTNMDVKIVVLSYLAMFVYVSLTLGNGFATRDESLSASLLRWATNFPKLFARPSLDASTASFDSSSEPRFFPRLSRKIFIGSRFMLGLFGISLVILSVSASVGFFSGVGVKVTLIIAEVIPFLVLAVGVDNVFILVNELDRQNMLHGPNAAAPEPAGPYASPTRRVADESLQEDSVEAASMPLYLSPEERVARTVARMGPSILLSSITETLAFLLGALVPMPAVRNFALYAAGSVFLNAVLQMTVFISALVLDLRRSEANRVDCFPCIRLSSRIQLPESTAPGIAGTGMLARLIRKYYAPFILRPLAKVVIALFFGGVFIASVISIQHIQLGLDQRLALPSDSYLIQWFDDVDTYLDIGPPVYFVSHDINVTAREGQQHLCGRFTTCDELSVANLLEVERRRTDVSYLSQPSASWIDDFLRWLNPEFEDCCRVLKRDPSTFCGPRDRERSCQPCFAGRESGWNVTMNGLPEGDEFVHYLKQWLLSPPSEDCPLGGRASYGGALSVVDNDVVASHFRTFFEPLKSQEDFIGAFAAAHRIANELSESTGAPVFPYSLFFVFFDQYAHIVAITQEVLGLGLAAVLVVTSLFLGSWRTGTIVTATVALTVVNVMGFMALWGISLNALSLVNLVISLGIAVEFCAHVARAFMTSGSGDHPAGQKERDDRMWTALTDVGPSVLSGITFTKLIGMCVLALTHSKLLEIYYFRMWLTLIVSGALHGLVLLPVILSLAGGSGFPIQDADEEWMANALRSDYEYTPFLTDDASYHSD